MSPDLLRSLGLGSNPDPAANELLMACRRRLDDLPNLSAMRCLAAEIRHHTLAHLDHYLEQLNSSVGRTGGHVHFAAAAEDAERIVHQLKAQRKVRQIDQFSPGSNLPSAEPTRGGLDELAIVTGDFVVAQSGHVCIAENEPDALWSIDTARVLVSVVGIDRILPRLSDLALMLKLRARGMSAQVMTDYTTLAGGGISNRTPLSDEAGIDREFHLILLDEGRSRLLGSEFRETLRCIGCAACAAGTVRDEPLCPVDVDIASHVAAFKDVSILPNEPTRRSSGDSGFRRWLKTLIGPRKNSQTNLAAASKRDRAAMIKRIRRSLTADGSPSTTVTPPDLDEPTTRLVHTAIGLPTLFEATAAANNLQVEPIRVDDLAERMAAYFGDQSIHKIAVWAGPLFEQLSLVDVLRNAGLAARWWNEMTVQELLEVDCAVTTVSSAVAETGSVVFQSNGYAGGRAGDLAIVPALHVAVVEPKNLVPDLVDLFEQLSSDSAGQNVSILSGTGRQRLKVFLLE